MILHTFEIYLKIVHFLVQFSFKGAEYYIIIIVESFTSEI